MQIGEHAELQEFLPGTGASLQFGRSSRFGLWFGQFRHYCFGQEESSCYRDSIFERNSHNLCRVDNFSLNKIDICIPRSVETNVVPAFQHASDYNAAIDGRIFRDLASQCRKSTLQWRYYTLRTTANSLY